MFINAFIGPSNKVMVLLTSIEVCAVGLNFVGAVRVVLLYVVWNPSFDKQATSQLKGSKQCLVIQPLMPQ